MSRAKGRSQQAGGCRAPRSPDLKDGDEKAVQSPARCEPRSSRRGREARQHSKGRKAKREAVTKANLPNPGEQRRGRASGPAPGAAGGSPARGLGKTRNRRESPTCGARRAELHPAAACPAPPRPAGPDAAPARPLSPAAPSLASGSPLARGLPGAGGLRGRAPRPQRAACQTRREGSALFGLLAGREFLVGFREEAPYMARGGRGRAGGGEAARDGGRFRRRRTRPAPSADPPLAAAAPPRGRRRRLPGSEQPQPQAEPSGNPSSALALALATLCKRLSPPQGIWDQRSGCR